jgi:hypothetical protein
MTTTFAEDWVQLCRSSQLPITLAAWVAAEPVLGGLGLDDVMRRARDSSVDLAASDATVAALLRLGLSDPLAHRTVLQAVLPRLIGVARRYADRGRWGVREVTADLAAVTWEELTGAEGRWTRHLAARLCDLVESRYRQARRHERYEDPTGDIDDAVDRCPRDCGQLVVGRLDVTRLLQAAVERGVIGADAARVLEHAAFDGLTDAEIAACRGGTAAATKKARQRAAAALRTHPVALALLAG